MAIKHVHSTLTSLNGCKVEIDDDVVNTLIPLRVKGFHGAIHISGGSGCPNRDLYFGIEPKDKVVSKLAADKNKP